jgi:hypothetical protein
MDMRGNLRFADSGKRVSKSQQKELEGRATVDPIVARLVVRSDVVPKKISTAMRRRHGLLG